MFTDERRRNVWDQIRQYDLRAFAKWLTPDLLMQAAGDAGLRVGRGPLSLVNLTWLAVASALHTSKSFADVLGLTLKLLSDTEGFASTPLGKEQRNAKRRIAAGSRSGRDHGQRGGVYQQATLRPDRVLACPAGFAGRTLRGRSW